MVFQAVTAQVRKPEWHGASTSQALTERDTKIEFKGQRVSTVDTNGEDHTESNIQQVNGADESDQTLPEYQVLRGRSRRLKELPYPRLLSSEFELHIRNEVLRSVRDSLEFLSEKLDRPGVATALSSLRKSLTDSYEKIGERSDSESLAFIVSGIQDYFTLHWSEMSPDKLQTIDGILESLEEKDKISRSWMASILRKIAVLREGPIEFPTTEDLYLTEENEEELDSLN